MLYTIKLWFQRYILKKNSMTHLQYQRNINFLFAMWMDGRLIEVYGHQYDHSLTLPVIYIHLCHGLRTTFGCHVILCQFIMTFAQWLRCDIKYLLQNHS